MVNFSGVIPVVLGLAGGLIAILAVGAAAIGWARVWRRRQGVDRVDWENMLADCKNLESQGVLSEDEYRKIRTIVGHRRSSP